MSYRVPKYHFQDIRAEVMAEVIQGIEDVLPQPSWEEIDHWLNCHSIPATILSHRVIPDRELWSGRRKTFEGANAIGRA